MVTRLEPRSMDRTPPAGPTATFSPWPSRRRHDVMKWRAYLTRARVVTSLSLIHISEPTRRTPI
eukprot:1647827-Pleurochrysis_carterae.AAC.1